MTKKHRYTPGPWFVAGTKVVDKKPDSSSPGIYHWDSGVNYREICDASSTFDVEDYDEQYANACLMSAAPEMNECLTEICEMCKRGEIKRLHRSCAGCRIAKAIEKAEGCIQ